MPPISGPSPTRADPPVTSCLVATTPWAGGQKLCAALLASGHVGNPEDYFNPARAVTRSRAWGILGSEADFAASYMVAARDAATGGNGACSVNLPWSHLTWMLGLARAGLGPTGTTAYTDADAVAAWFPGPRYVHLHCHDTARQALRWYGARQGEGDAAAGGGRPDLQEVRWLELLIERQARSWHTYFTVHGIEPYGVTYEQLIGSPAAVADRVLGWLDLPVGAAQPGESAESGGLEAVVERWLDEYLEAKAALRATVGLRQVARG